MQEACLFIEEMKDEVVAEIIGSIEQIPSPKERNRLGNSYEDFFYNSDKTRQF